MNKKIYIQGMHCVSCEMLIKRAAETIEGVKVEYISAGKGMMHVHLPDESKLPLVHQCICDAGYTVAENAPADDGQAHLHRYNLDRLLLSVIIVSILVFIVYKLDLVQYVPSIGDNLSLGVALLMGIIASVSTCLAIVGSIVIGFSEYGDTQTGTKEHIRTQLAFQAGRIGGFFILGGILGLIGQAISISLTTTTILTIVVGIVVLWMGLHLLHILPNITAMGLHLPKSRSERTLTTKNPVFAPLVGALTFFLPCGFTLSMQLIAINTGDFRQGGLAMAIFALGTAPVLFAVGLGSSYVKEHKFKLLHTIIGTLIVFFGLFMIINGRRMLGGLSAFTNTPQKSVNQYYENQYYELDREIINVGHDGLRLVPEIVTLTAGGNYQLIITPTNNGRGCMSTLTIPGLDRSVNRIVQGEPIVYNFTNIPAGSYSVVCGAMGMYQGQIIVQ